VAHLVNGDELNVFGQFAEILIIQLEVLVHVLVSGLDFHGHSLFQHLDNFVPVFQNDPSLELLTIILPQ
jgi:hypothetical protein